MRGDSRWNLFVEVADFAWSTLLSFIGTDTFNVGAQSWLIDNSANVRRLKSISTCLQN